MSLQARLTLLVSGTVGGILLLLGTAVYIFMSVSLMRSSDEKLRTTVETIIEGVNVANVGTLNQIQLPGLYQDTNFYVQFWDNQGSLVSYSSNLGDVRTSIDPVGLKSFYPIYRNTFQGIDRWRVLSVPIKVSGQDRRLGVIQVGMLLRNVENTEHVLFSVLVTGCLVAMVISAVAGWYLISHSFSPLKSVTETALQITRADDLSRRIPYSGPSEDEVGQLIKAFNQTLSRLEQLFDSQKRFIADVGHELRTPLTVIKGNAELMRRMNCSDDESLSSIESEVDRLTRMVGDLLLLAQAESGKLPLIMKTIELDTLMLEVMQQMKVLARGRLSMKLGEIDQVLVCGDQDRIKQVLVNLISNAIKYTPDGGEVIVGLGKVNSKACLVVSDSGPGIPPEDMPHLFERFYRGEKSRTRSKDGKGYGLGLSIAYWIIQNHGGNIEVSNREPRGSTFTVWLPLPDGPCEGLN
jgi:two-component system, OmpR family, sensor kinase